MEGANGILHFHQAPPPTMDLLYWETGVADGGTYYSGGNRQYDWIKKFSSSWSLSKQQTGSPFSVVKGTCVTSKGKPYSTCIRIIPFDCRASDRCSSFAMWSIWVSSPSSTSAMAPRQPSSYRLTLRRSSNIKNQDLRWQGRGTCRNSTSNVC